MNTGIAIVLNDTLSGNSVLGNVTFIESVEHKITRLTNNYCEALGTNIYAEQIRALFTSIVSGGIDTKLYGLYPILGDTILKQKINAINPGVFDLNLGANASASEKGLLFSQGIAVGDMTQNTEKVGNGHSLSQLSVIYADNLLQNSSCVSFYAKTIENVNQNGIWLGTELAGTPATRQYITFRRTSNLSSIYNTIGSSPSCFIIRFDSNGITTQFNSDEPITSAFDFSGSTYETYANNALGYNMTKSAATGTSGESTTSAAERTNLFGGHVYFHALGDLSLVELITLKNAVSAFLASVKQIDIL